MDHISLQSHMELLKETSQGLGEKCKQGFSKLIMQKNKYVPSEEFGMLLGSANSEFFSDHNHLLSEISHFWSWEDMQLLREYTQLCWEKRGEVSVETSLGPREDS